MGADPVAGEPMRILLGTILLLGFVGVCLKKMVDSINGYYADKQEKTSRARRLLDHGVIRKVK